MVTSFPFGNGLIEASFDIFRGSSQSLLKFVPLIFLVRLVIMKASFGGSRDYGNLMKELLFLYVGFFIFQEVMEIVMRSPEIAELVINSAETPEVELINKEKSFFEWAFGISASDIMKMLSSIVYWLVCFCYLVLMAFMVAIGAYIILFSTLFRMRWMVGAYISIVLILSMWPFVWYSVDQAFIFVVRSLNENNHHTGVIIASFVGGLLKLSVPVVGALAAMKTPVSMGSKLKENIGIGARPFKATSNRSKNLINSAGNSLGFNKAIESVRKDPILREEKRVNKEKYQRFQLDDTAPALAYGARRVATQIRSKVTRTDLNNHESFKDFKERVNRQHHQRNVIKTENKLQSGKVTDISKKQRISVSQEKSLKALSQESSHVQKEFNSTQMTNNKKRDATFTEHHKKSSVYEDRRFKDSLASSEDRSSTRVRSRFNKDMES